MPGIGMNSVIVIHARGIILQSGRPAKIIFRDRVEEIPDDRAALDHHQRLVEQTLVAPDLIHRLLIRRHSHPSA